MERLTLLIFDVLFLFISVIYVLLHIEMGICLFVHKAFRIMLFMFYCVLFLFVKRNA